MRRDGKQYLNGVMGVIVGDALGCPVQFMSRKEIAANPVTGMRGYGTYNMPEGTWTDDGSMTLAMLDSLNRCKGYDLTDIMESFVRWEADGAYTPFGEAFDEGGTCLSGIYNYHKGKDVYSCGLTDSQSNGNGSLMRTMPVCLYAYDGERSGNLSEEEAVRAVHEVSGLTHNHLRSKMACGLYYFMVRAILDHKKAEQAAICEEGITPANTGLQSVLQKGLNDGFRFYGKKIENLTEIAYYGRLFYLDEFHETPMDKIGSSGYVVESLEAAVWCLITTENFRECLLKAANLGKDTDTVAAIAGGLAGSWYDYAGMPEEWLACIKRREWIEQLCGQEVEYVYLPKDLPVTDMHIHIIPGVDDGADDMEVSLEMLRLEAEQGVTSICATSHSDAYDWDAEKTIRQYEELKKRAAELFPQLTITLGCEVACQVSKMHQTVEKLKNGTYPTIAGTRYVLAEFATKDKEENVCKCLQILLDNGYVPLIAHVERYEFTTLPFIRKAKDMGCLIQVNYYSLSEERKKSTRDLAVSIVENHLADVMGSDAHRMDHRRPKISAGARKLLVLTDQDYAASVLDGWALFRELKERAEGR